MGELYRNALLRREHLLESLVHLVVVRKGVAGHPDEVRLLWFDSLDELDSVVETEVGVVLAARVGPRGSKILRI